MTSFKNEACKTMLVLSFQKEAMTCSDQVCPILRRTVLATEEFRQKAEKFSFLPGLPVVASIHNLERTETFTSNQARTMEERQNLADIVARVSDSEVDIDLNKRALTQLPSRKRFLSKICW